MNNYLVGGFSPSLWKMMEFVRWDDDIRNIWKNKIHVPTHQPVILYVYIYIYQLYRWVYKAAKKTGELPLQEQLRGKKVTGGLFPVWAGNSEQTRTSREKKSSNPKGIVTISLMTCWFIHADLLGLPRHTLKH